MKKIKVINVVGARPNFMKIAPIIAAMNRFPGAIEHLLVHTGQHYDARMSKVFFADLGLPQPDINLGVQSGSHAEQTAAIMVRFEKICQSWQPDLVVVVGDVNSTLACSLTAKKMGIKVAHVEAGLRSRDMTMPEEINRLLTDALADFLFTTDRLASSNLQQENIAAEKIFFVGNVMIDTLLKHRQQAAALSLCTNLGLQKKSYGIVTLHRPANVDNKSVLEDILAGLQQLAYALPLVFPVHPRTRQRIEDFRLLEYCSVGDNAGGLWLTEPFGYLEFLHLVLNSRMVLTDSGGLQEETTVLGIPCLTLRPNTERPITCQQGTNRVIGSRSVDLLAAAGQLLKTDPPEHLIPEKWDGRAADRIVDIIRKSF